MKGHRLHRRPPHRAYRCARGVEYPSQVSLQPVYRLSRHRVRSRSRCSRIPVQPRRAGLREPGVPIRADLSKRLRSHQRCSRSLAARVFCARQQPVDQSVSDRNRERDGLSGRRTCNRCSAQHNRPGRRRYSRFGSCKRYRPSGVAERHRRVACTGRQRVAPVVGERQHLQGGRHFCRKNKCRRCARCGAGDAGPSAAGSRLDRYV